MAGSIDREYWDSCLLIAWLKNEQRKQEEVRGLAHRVDQWDKGQSHIYTSTLTFTEILPSTLPPGAYDQLRAVCTERTRFNLMGVTRRIAELAAELREHYQGLPDGLPTITTPDAIHLATAITSRCDCFYTFDQHDNLKRPSRALVPLSTWFEKQHSLHILVPPPPPPRLFED